MSSTRSSILSDERKLYDVIGPGSSVYDRNANYSTTTCDMSELEPAHRDLLRIVMQFKIDRKPRAADLEQLEQNIREWLSARTASKKASYDEAINGVILRSSRSHGSFGHSSADADKDSARKRLTRNLRQFFSLSRLSATIQNAKITKSVSECASMCLNVPLL